MEDFIQLKKGNILTIGIKNAKGKDTGEKLIFDLEDIELPLKYQECLELHKKNVNYLQNQMIIIDKKQDHKGKKLLSHNEEEKIKLIKEFYKKEMEAMDLFLGEGKCELMLKIMNRKPYWTMFNDISDAIEPILPLIKQKSVNIKDMIKNKYKVENNSVLKDE